jgi:Cu(I)/Ag(I) efflux system membrane fusion protein
LLRLLSRDVRRAVQNYVGALQQLRDASAKSPSGASDRLRDQVDMMRHEVIELGVDPDTYPTVDDLPDPFEDIVLRAPFDCVVVRCDVRAGEQVVPGTPLIEVADREALIAELRVSRADGRYLRAGLATEVFDPQDAAARFPARVVRVSDAVDAGTQSAVVRIAIDKAGGELHPGTAIAATIRVPLTDLPEWKSGTPRGVLAVPETAVVDTGRARIVYVESSPGVFDAREVVLGPRIGAFYPVVSGLDAGVRVATAGSFLLDAETRFSQ